VTYLILFYMSLHYMYNFFSFFVIEHEEEGQSNFDLSGEYHNMVDEVQRQTT
ncbi:hypothetical protein L9F63_021274, partial [Diploptera punctata]